MNIIFSYIFFLYNADGIHTPQVEYNKTYKMCIYFLNFSTKCVYSSWYIDNMYMKENYDLQNKRKIIEMKRKNGKIFNFSFFSSPFLFRIK